MVVYKEVGEFKLWEDVLKLTCIHGYRGWRDFEDHESSLPGSVCKRPGVNLQSGLVWQFVTDSALINKFYYNF